MDFKNSYEDAARAEAYSRLDFSGTYYLAFRDLPEMISAHVTGKKALDFGCGTGRSTRFLRGGGFDVVGIDVAEDMVQKARELDPGGDYRVVTGADFGGIPDGVFDLVLSAFTFDNIPTMEKKIDLFNELKRVMRTDGRIINLVSSPDIYLHEWVSFSTKDYPENARAKCGDRVQIIITDIDDKRPVEDIVWPDEDYREVFRRTGLQLLESRKPLGKVSEPYPWVNETRIAPWVIYVLGKTGTATK